MGNSASAHGPAHAHLHQLHLRADDEQPHSWAHTPHHAHFARTSSFKVLPEPCGAGQKLRPTNNGAILHNGGTISGRKPPAPSFQSKVQKYSTPNGHTGYVEYNRPEVYGSAPDLRYERSRYKYANEACSKRYAPEQQCNRYSASSESSAKARIVRTKKKYKAPNVPQLTSGDSSSPDSYQNQWESNISGESADLCGGETPARKSRLFKTRAETKRPTEQPIQNRKQPHYKGVLPGHLQRSFSSPQFQDELNARLKERATAVREPPVGKAASPILRVKESLAPQPDRNDAMAKSHNAASNRQPKISQNCKPNIARNNKNGNSFERPPLNGKEITKKPVENINKREFSPTKKINKTTRSESYRVSNHPVNEKLREKPVEKERDKQNAVKKFYFGMKDEAETEILYTVDEVVDKFAASLRKSATDLKNTSSPSQSYSSVPTTDEASPSISLKLRPTLPRKQLDIPRFSPTTAWRLLSSLESPLQTSEEDDSLLIEEGLVLPQPARRSARFSHDKSADSGISGDTSPPHHSSQHAWTPQQDLDETSSDGGLASAPLTPDTLKYSPRFCLSLPRDERFDRKSSYQYADKVPSDVGMTSYCRGFQKLKRSVGEVLGKQSEGGMTATSSSLDQNWVLSRSVPNLMQTSANSNKFDEQDGEGVFSSSLSRPPSFSYLANGGHVMYLPEYSSNCRQRGEPSLAIPIQASKSYEDLSAESNKYEQRQQSGLSNNIISVLNSKSNRKFTFQSTVRQIERKKIADKLSKEAEEKEKLRIRELEAMKSVEEEFQKKRAQEKANIRHQLRLYNLTEGREQPDGAVLPSPPPSTKILSEFSQPRRDYRDYPNRHSDGDNISRNSDAGSRRETIHPQVVYQMPKNSQVYVAPRIGTPNGGRESLLCTPRSDNYRKEFAQGALASKSVLASSDSDISQANARPHSRMNKRSGSISDDDDEDAIDNTENNHLPSAKIPRVVHFTRHWDPYVEVNTSHESTYPFRHSKAKSTAAPPILTQYSTIARIKRFTLSSIGRATGYTFTPNSSFTLPPRNSDNSNTGKNSYNNDINLIPSTLPAKKSSKFSWLLPFRRDNAYKPVNFGMADTLRSPKLVRQAMA